MISLTETMPYPFVTVARITRQKATEKKKPES